MNHSAWFTRTATYLWRTFFWTLSHNISPDTPAKQKQFDICRKVFDAFSPEDQNAIRHYYTCRWGDHIYAVEDYSARTGIPTTVLWMIVNNASRAVIEELGILDPKN